MKLEQAQQVIKQIKEMANSDFSNGEATLKGGDINTLIKAVEIVERDRCNKILQQEIRIDMPFFVVDDAKVFTQDAMEKIMRTCIRHWRYLKKMAGRKILGENIVNDPESV